MPFNEQFKDIYEFGIKAACVEAGAYCERVDEQFFHESMLERIYNQIAKADVLVADMTGRNPNVFYEVGYAHALGKRPILLTQRSDDIPFDFKHFSHIVYEGKITGLKEDLYKKVRWALENPIGFKGGIERQFDFVIRDISILMKKQIELLLADLPTSAFSFVLNINNSTARSIEVQRFKLGLVVKPDLNVTVTEGVRSRHIKTTTIRTRAENLWIIAEAFEVMPGCWEQINVAFSRETEFDVNGVVDLTLRVFTSTGPQDYPCNFILTQKSTSIK